MESKLKLYLYINEFEDDNWYCYESFEEFYNDVIDEEYNLSQMSEEPKTREEIKDFLENDMFVQFHEIDDNCILRLNVDDDDFDLDYESYDLYESNDEDDDGHVLIVVRDFVKEQSKGYVGQYVFDLFNTTFWRDEPWN